MKTKRHYGPALFFSTAVIAAAVAVIAGSAEARPVLLPLVSLVVLAAFFITRIWKRDRILPVFEIGSVFVLISLLYSSFPLLNYLAGPLQWTPASDVRLQYYGMITTPRDVGAFGWWYVLYLGGFIAVYLLVRRSAGAYSPRVTLPPKHVQLILVSVTVGLMVYFLIMATFFDLSYANDYQEREAGIGLGTHLPYVVLQISHNLRGILSIGKQCILLLLVMQWRHRWARVVAAGWIIVEASILLVRFGSRSELMLLVLSTVLAYHRFVRPLTMRVALVSVTLVVFCFLGFGFLRDYVHRDQRVPVEVTSTSVLTADNEFQALWATAFDLKMRRQYADLNVPWQIYVSDFYMVIPSQLLPFQKWDPSDWYLDVLGMLGGQTGFMFGVAAQAVVGFGIWEMLLRGMVLGLIFGLLHRWYVHYQHSFWAVSLYLFCCVWTHYTFRSTSFYSFYFVVYRWVPFFIGITGTAWLLSSVKRFRPATAPIPVVAKG